MQRYWILIGLAALLVLAACQNTTPTPSPTPTEAPATATPEPPTPTPKPTAVPQQVIFCATEPSMVSPFVPSQSGDDLLALFYEEPIEQVQHRWEPRLVERLPTLENGDVITQVATVVAGGRYVDVDGVVRVNEDEEPLHLPQMIITFTIKSQLFWSDGLPLTTNDMLLGYYLAQSIETRGRWRNLVERTERFTAPDTQHLQWVGLPGYLSADYPGFLFPPQPAHRWQGQSLSKILQDRTPPATGPFEIVSWESGHEVRLERNLYYQGVAPKLETVIFRFPQVAPSGWSSLLLNGECDVLLPDPVADTDWQQWTKLNEQGSATIWADIAPTVLRLDFNIAPPDQKKSPLTDLRTRQALATCIDRARLSEALPGESLMPAESFIPPGHPAYDTAMISRTVYNPDTGRALLDEIGWRDEDGDHIREAHGIPDIKDGTQLSLTLHLAPQYFVSAAYIAADLETCEVGVAPIPIEPQLLYAADAVSPLFGRTFQMVLYGWRAELPLVCGSWQSMRIPTEDNDWYGENFSGYASADYDAACRRALSAIDEETQWAALQEAQLQLTKDLPTLFLSWRPFWFVARPQIQGLKPDSSAYSTIWNIEDIYVAP